MTENLTTMIRGNENVIGYAYRPTGKKVFFMALIQTMTELTVYWFFILI